MGMIFAMLIFIWSLLY